MMTIDEFITETELQLAHATTELHAGLDAETFARCRELFARCRELRDTLTQARKLRTLMAMGKKERV